MTSATFTFDRWDNASRMAQRLRADFMDAAQEDGRAIERAMFTAAQLARTEVINEIHATTPHQPVDTGQMVRGWVVKRVDGGAVLENGVEHTVYMELGTRPHWAPIGALRDWAKRKLRGGGRAPEGAKVQRRRKRRKGGRSARDQQIERMARGAQRKIAREGTKPRWFFKRASAHFDRVLEYAIRHELVRSAVRRGGP